MQKQAPNPETCEGWRDFIRLPITNRDLPHEDLRRLRIILASDHFGIISPFRSFDINRSYDTRKGDMTLGTFLNIGYQEGKSWPDVLAERNVKAWTILWNWVNGLGSGATVIPVSGHYKDAFGAAALEAAMVIPGIQTHLTKALMVEMARTFNQDSFIYAGPEVGREVRLFSVSDRGQSGLPLAYDHIKTIGKTYTMEDIENLLASIYKID